MSVVNVPAKLVKSWLDSGEAELVDVREDIEFHTSHIESAHHHPLGKIVSDDLPANGKKIVIYCLKGARGKKACDKVIGDLQGATIYNLEGGIDAWKSAGYQVVEGSKKVMPLDRQVQITVGGGVLASVIAAQLVNPDFIWLAGFFGAGLLFAGLSGICALARLLTIMPWNRV